MIEDRPRYYSVRRNGSVAYWTPGKFAEGYGFKKCVSLGPAGADAKAAAIKWNEKLDAARAAKKSGKPPPKYKPGSLAAFYDWFKTQDAWALMERRTHEDYERAWPHIEKRFGDTMILHISAGDSEAFHVDIHPAHPASPKRDKKGLRKLPWNAAHRVLKVWRALLSAQVDYGFRPAPAPIGRVTNPAPRGRAAVWLHDEVTTLAETAGWGGHLGMALAIRLGWDAMLSPIDVWALPIGGWRSSKAGGEINTSREKTDKPVFHAVTDETAVLVDLYIDYLKAAGASVDPEQPLIRQANLKPFPDKDRFSKIFRAVRAVAFPGDTRQFLDLRRSAMTEARMGGATKDDLGKAAANRVDDNETLASTYILAASRNVLAARTRGRSPMAAKFGPDEPS